MSGSGVRVSIPNNVRKTIQNIKEITGNHSEDEIYAMLKDCSMDPNETAQKLLLQDPFHEVKRKRDKKKENINNRESGDARPKPSTQGRGSRGGRGNFSSRYTSHDASGGRNSGLARDNVSNQAVEKGARSLSASQETSKDTSPSASSAVVVTNGAPGEASGSTIEMHSSDLPRGSQTEVAFSRVVVDKLGSKLASIDAEKAPNIAFGDVQGELTSSSNDPVPVTAPLLSTVCFSSSDPVLVPSSDSRLPGSVGAIKREVGSHRIISESTAVIPAEKSASEVGATFLQGKMPNKSQVAKGQLTDSSQPLSASGHAGSSGSRPSSNYSNRSQQVIGLQKVVSTKEWKPKPANANVPQGSGTVGSSAVISMPVEARIQPQPLSSNILDSEEATSKLQKKLEELHLPQRQHVIIPNHIHVPESERTKLSFGSFDASFGARTNVISGPESEKSPTPLSDTSQGVDETLEEQTPSTQETLATTEDGPYPEHPHSPSHATENLSGDADVSSSAIPEYSEPKQENALLSGTQQYTVMQTSPSYNFGFVPPMLSGQIAPFENSESQARDVSRLPSFVVQQPFDPASYYAQFYRSGAESDGRVSPFPSPAVAAKYNGNVAVPPHAPQPPQEGGNSLVLSTAGPTPMATQAAGLMQSSLAATQQTLPVFRPPTGLHIPHYPPNYIPYGHYFSPFYVPPPGIHQFLSNGAFPQQHQPGNVYPAPPAAAAMGVKYSLPQYKPGGNTGNSAHVGMASGYGPYGSSPAGYNPSSAAAAGGNSTSNEDLSASQYKENNVYMSNQQSEGSAVWIAGPGRDLSSLPASSFYNLPPQGQHVTFAPTQAGHGTFASIYQPAQAVTAAAVHPLLQQSQAMAGAVDMVGPAASVYQQPQHQQINWPSNY